MRRTWLLILLGLMAALAAALEPLKNPVEALEERPLAEVQALAGQGRSDRHDGPGQYAE